MSKGQMSFGLRRKGQSKTSKVEQDKEVQEKKRTGPRRTGQRSMRQRTIGRRSTGQSSKGQKYLVIQINIHSLSPHKHFVRKLPRLVLSSFLNMKFLSKNFHVILFY